MSLRLALPYIRAGPLTGSSYEVEYAATSVVYMASLPLHVNVLNQVRLLSDPTCKALRAVLINRPSWLPTCRLWVGGDTDAFCDIPHPAARAC